MYGIRTYTITDKHDEILADKVSLRDFKTIVPVQIRRFLNAVDLTPLTETEKYYTAVNEKLRLLFEGQATLYDLAVDHDIRFAFTDEVGYSKDYLNQVFDLSKPYTELCKLEEDHELVVTNYVPSIILEALLKKGITAHDLFPGILRWIHWPKGETLEEATTQLFLDHYIPKESQSFIKYYKPINLGTEEAPEMHQLVILYQTHDDMMEPWIIENDQPLAYAIKKAYEGKLISNNQWKLGEYLKVNPDDQELYNQDNELMTLDQLKALPESNQWFIIEPDWMDKVPTMIPETDEEEPEEEPPTKDVSVGDDTPINNTTDKDTQTDPEPETDDRASQTDPIDVLPPLKTPVWDENKYVLPDNVLTNFLAVDTDKTCDAAPITLEELKAKQNDYRYTYFNTDILYANLTPSGSYGDHEGHIYDFYVKAAYNKILRFSVYTDIWDHILLKAALTIHKDNEIINYPMNDAFKKTLLQKIMRAHKLETNTELIIPTDPIEARRELEANQIHPIMALSKVNKDIMPQLVTKNEETVWPDFNKDGNYMWTEKLDDTTYYLLTDITPEDADAMYDGRNYNFGAFTFLKDTKTNTIYKYYVTGYDIDTEKQTMHAAGQFLAAKIDTEDTAESTVVEPVQSPLNKETYITHFLADVNRMVVNSIVNRGTITQIVPEIK